MALLRWIRPNCVRLFVRNVPLSSIWKIRLLGLAPLETGSRIFGVKAKGMNIAGKTIDEFAQETEVSFERKFESPTQYLMPVPLTDVNRNMNLVQNPGY